MKILILLTFIIGIGILPIPSAGMDFSRIPAAPLITADRPGLTGFGIMSCEEYEKLYQTSPDIAANRAFDWATGFTSGLNYLDFKLDSRWHEARGITEESFISPLNVYCNQHPKHTLAAAVLVVIAAIFPVKIY